jgi:hypothetical protein
MAILKCHRPCVLCGVVEHRTHEHALQAFCFAITCGLQEITDPALNEVSVRSLMALLHSHRVSAIQLAGSQ